MASLNISLDESLTIFKKNCKVSFYIKPFLSPFHFNRLIESISYDNKILFIRIKQGMLQKKAINSIKNTLNSKDSIKNDYSIYDDKIYIKLNKLIKHLGINGLNIKKIVFKNNSLNVLFNRI
jgi:hypothetical protein